MNKLGYSQFSISCLFILDLMFEISFQLKNKIYQFNANDTSLDLASFPKKQEILVPGPGSHEQ